MASQDTQVLLGVRVPLSLKERLSQYCQSNGVKMNFFVAAAIRERLIEMSEDKADLATAMERMKNPEFAAPQEAKKYFAKRGVKE